MTIVEALRARKIDKVIRGNVQLSIDSVSYKFIVRKCFIEFSTVLLETDDEEEAVARLIRS